MERLFVSLSDQRPYAREPKQASEASRMASQPSQASQAEAKSQVDQYPAQTHCHLFNEIFFGTDRQEFHVRFMSLIISRTTALRPGMQMGKRLAVWLCAAADSVAAESEVLQPSTGRARLCRDCLASLGQEPQTQLERAVSANVRI